MKAQETDWLSLRCPVTTLETLEAYLAAERKKYPARKLSRTSLVVELLEEALIGKIPETAKGAAA